MEVGQTRWYVTVAAVVATVTLLLGLLSWRVAVALPAAWSTPVQVTQPPSGSDSEQSWTATIPAGWAKPKKTSGSEVSLVDANDNRISGGLLGATPEQACSYLVIQATSSTKYERTDLPGRTVNGQPAIAVRLVATERSTEVRCFPGTKPDRPWFLQLTYRTQDSAAAQQAFDDFATSFRLR